MLQFVSLLTELEPVWTHATVKSSGLRDGKEGTRKASYTTPHGIFSFSFQDTHARSAIQLPFDRRNTKGAIGYLSIFFAHWGYALGSLCCTVQYNYALDRFL
jgi:hypothetical protein